MNRDDALDQLFNLEILEKKKWKTYKVSPEFIAELSFIESHIEEGILRVKPPTVRLNKWRDIATGNFKWVEHGMDVDEDYYRYTNITKNIEGLDN